MSTKTLLNITVVLTLVFSFSVVSAQQESQPHRFQGKVLINNQPAQDGISIIAKVGNVPYGTGKTVDGKYGYYPNIFDVRDTHSTNEGKTIMFYVNGVKAAEETFKNGISSTLDLSITQSNTGNNNQGNGGGGGGGSALSSQECSWECSEWTLCSIGNKKYRVCLERNGCDPEEGRPSEAGECEYQGSPTCSPDWSCSEWSGCTFGTQVRVCADSNSCGVEGPETVKNCGDKHPDAPLGITGFFVANMTSIIASVFGLIILLGGLIYWRARA